MDLARRVPRYPVAGDDARHTVLWQSGVASCLALVQTCRGFCSLLYARVLREGEQLECKLTGEF